MTNARVLRLAIGTAVLGLYGIVPLARAVNTVTFSPTAAGITKSVPEWGVDTAWPSFDNVRQSVAHMGVNNVDVTRVTFYTDQPLVANANGTYSLNATARSRLDAQLNLAALAGANKLLTFVPTVGETHSSYLGASGINVDQWSRLIKTTQEYINSRPGFTTRQIAAIEPFNEPDYWAGQGTPEQLNSVIAQLKTHSVFATTQFQAASTLASTNAQFWYDRVPLATQGSSHLLGGNLTSYANFIGHVRNTGRDFVNPELHSLGEALIGADRGMVSGTWWADVLRARGLFVRASDGVRLGYSENLARQSAAAVYRAPDGQMYAFAGGVERFGQATAYRFASDQDVYFNGIKVREFMLQTKFDEEGDFEKYGSWSNQGAYADIDTDASGIPALDGYRWKIVNAATGQVMEVQGSGTNDGATIRTAADQGGLNQMWNIVRTRNGYYELYNANSGRTAEVANGSLNNGATVRQWGTADNAIQQWYIDEAGGGAFYLRNAHSNKYMNGGSSSNTQGDLSASPSQRWRFVRENPNLPAKAQLAFQGNATSSTGTNHATTFGTPTYGAGPTGFGQALQFSGDDHAQLPAGAASSENITIATWVKWDGGDAWQRIFDFGNNTTSYMFLTPRSGDNTMRFGITTKGGDGEEILETAALPTGQWVHLALTLGGNTGILYVNGAPRVAGQIILDPNDINATLNYLGKSQYPDALFRGALDDFRIYDYALDPTQIGSLVPETWSVDADGTWATGSNWQYGVAPNGAGHTAIFAGPTSAPRTVTVGSLTSLGTLNFGTTSGYTLAGPGPILLDAATGSAQVNVTAGNHTIATPLALADDASITVAAGASLNVTNAFDGGARLLTKAGAGTLQLAQLRNGRLDVQAGTVRVAPKTAAGLIPGASKLTALSIAGGATLDLSDNALAIDYTGASAGTLLSDVRGHLAAGRLVGASNDRVSLGYADNITLNRTTLDGMNVDASSVLIQLALTGDTNLSGTVDFDDLLVLAKHFNGTDKVWTEGDFDYDAAVDFDDLLSLAKNFNQSLSASQAATLGETFAADFALAQSLAPEPGTLLSLGLLGTLGRRRRP